jgi:hypothetical protein
MEQRPEPAIFYGAAIAALTGLLSGLVLPVAWQKHPGGPQIVFAPAAAAERGKPDAEPSATDQPKPDPPAAVQLAEADTGPVTPDPLPVTRLAPDMFDVQPAAAANAERQDAADVLADGAPQPPPRDLD